MTLKASKRLAAKSARRSAKKAAPRDAGKKLLAKGGGAGPAAGVTFQGWIGGFFAATGLDQAPIDNRLRLRAESISEVRLETESPIDDILLLTTAGGRLFIQAKNTVSLARQDSGEMAKVADQFVRQWRLCSEGKKSRGWDYPLNKERDRFVIAVGPETPRTVAIHLANALSHRSEGTSSDTTSQVQKKVLQDFTSLLKGAWKRVYGKVSTKREIYSILDLAVVLSFNFEGSDFETGTALLKGNLANKRIARTVFRTLAHECELRMKRRTSFTIREIRRVLEQNGVELLAPEDYRKDIEALRKRSLEFREIVAASTRLAMGTGKPIPVPRAVSSVSALAAKGGPFLIVGEPGSGKTGVLSCLADQMESEGHEIVLLKVAASGLIALKSDLGLSHPIREILGNWPGTAVAYLLIDGLDDARGGPADAEYREFIADVLALPENRWKVIASVRLFDLRAGQQYKSLFKGTPPDPDYAASGQDLADVRQIEVRVWTDSEFNLLLAQAPRLRKAIDAGGDRLREIALVPFNTQLLAEVISLGASDQELGSIRNQTDLLARYWTHRLAPLGAEGRACLKSAIDAMVAERALEAESGPLEKENGVTLDKVQQAGVLVARRNGRQVAFRHNILFDYAANKLFLDPFKPAELHALFLRDRGLGLMLGPALGYALQEVWADEPDHIRFWQIVVLLCGDKNVDPIARSLVARRAVEFTKSVGDIKPLADELPDTETSGTVQTRLVGAFVILSEDSPQSVAVDPWVYLAENSSSKGHLAGTTATLVERLLKSTPTEDALIRLGRAARNLLGYGFGLAKANPNFAAFCVPLVADTYTTDRDASRSLLEKVFERKRLKKGAHIEVPAIARNIATIAKCDPGFAVTIYGKTFSRVASQKETTFSDSQIMPLGTREADLYGTATTALAEYFPSFSEENLSEATRAAIAVVEGHIATQHPIAETKHAQNLTIEAANVQFIEDGSCFWAWEIDTTQPDSMQMIVQRHIENLRAADNLRASEIVSTLFAANRSALLWARLLMVGAERSSIYAPLLWDLATNETVLLCRDTAKDAVDAIAAFYPLRTVDERQAFEERVFVYGAGDPVYQSVREESLETLFQAIGEPNLVTDKARELATPRPGEPAAINNRPLSFHGSAVAYSFIERLQDNGVDTAAPANAILLDLIDSVNARTGFNNLPRPGIEDIPAAIDELKTIRAAYATAKGQGADIHVLGAARNLLGNGNRAILESAQRTKTTIADADLDVLLDTALLLSRHDGPDAHDIRELAVAQLYLLAQHPPVSKEATKRLEAMASDEDSGVRQAVALNLVTLFGHAPLIVWRQVKRFIEKEQEPHVLAQLTVSCLGQLRNHDPKRIEGMVFRIRDRFPYVASAERRDRRATLWEVSAKVLAGLYVWNDRTRSRRELFSWAESPLVYEDQLRNAIHQVQIAVSQGYDSDTTEFRAARERVQALLRRVIDVSAQELEAYRARGSKSQRAKKSEGGRYAKCLQYACASMFFGSGAFSDRNQDNVAPILSEDGKRRFVHDVEPMLRRLGDIAVPGTVYELIQLLDYLLVADPALCFDLFGHALMESGKKHGFQGESLGVDMLVKIVSRCLADHDFIFLDKVRKDSLIACLDLFVEAGWPNALRLVYRLPDSLR